MKKMQKKLLIALDKQNLVLINIVVLIRARL
jgi:hypothetical protein